MFMTSSQELDASDLDNPAGLRFMNLLGIQRWRKNCHHPLAGLVVGLLEVLQRVYGAQRYAGSPVVAQAC